MEGLTETYCTPSKSRPQLLTNRQGAIEHCNTGEQAKKEEFPAFERLLGEVSALRGERSKISASGVQGEMLSEEFSNLKRKWFGKHGLDTLEKQKSYQNNSSAMKKSESKAEVRSSFQALSGQLTESIAQISEQLKAINSKSSKRRTLYVKDLLSEEDQEIAKAITKTRFDNFKKQSQKLSYAGHDEQDRRSRVQEEGESEMPDPLARFSEAARLSSVTFQSDAVYSAEKLREQELEAKFREREEMARKEREEREAMEIQIREKEEMLRKLTQHFEEEKQRMLEDRDRLAFEIKEKMRSKERQLEEFENLKKALCNADTTISTIREALEVSEAQRMSVLNQLQEVRGNLRIYCRIRPVKETEERVVSLIGKTNKEINYTGDSSKRGKPYIYHFDRVFGENSAQDEVFQEVEPFIQSMLDGKRVSIFAYGPTGSGKTHTLEGINKNSDCLSETSGSMPRSLAIIVDWIIKHNLFSEPSNHLELTLSCLEIYNEQLRDLLSEDKVDQEIQIMFNKGKVILPDIVKRRIETVADALEAIRLSSKRRQTEATAWNSQSSRSHSIYRITVSKKIDGTETGLLNIIDMAGSEKNSSDVNSRDGGMSNSKNAAAHSGNDRLKKIQKEANFINKSLTTLGRIIRLIKQQRTMGLKEGCIPYRESKLTRLLQDCIGGDAQTLMIVNINPSMKSAGQTKETLNFASTACI